jgi:hypothetical protein
MTDGSPNLVDIRQATEAANAWRGRCVNLFARGELAISAALLETDPAAKVPRLLGQRLQLLRDAKKGLAAITHLENFAALLGERTALTHGSCKPWAGSGGWMLTLEWYSGIQRERRMFTERETEEFHRQLRTAVHRMESALRKPSSQTPGRSGTPSA